MTRAAAEGDDSANMLIIPLDWPDTPENRRQLHTIVRSVERQQRPLRAHEKEQQ